MFALLDSCIGQLGVNMLRTVIFANGVLADLERVRGLIRPSDVVLCADGGTRHALALGLRPDLLIGDLDSINERDRRSIQAAGVVIRPYSHDKNETDLELALRAALEQGASHILIIGALGNRLDHTLANIAMLSDSGFAGVDVRLDDGLEEVFFCRDQAEIVGETGDLVSLLPWGGAVEGVRTDGLKWPLHGEMLHVEKTRGISNEMLGGTARISIAAGLLLVVHRRQTQTENRAL